MRLNKACARARSDGAVTRTSPELWGGDFCPLLPGLVHSPLFQLSASVAPRGIPKEAPRHTSAARGVTSIAKLWGGDSKESIPGPPRRPNQAEGGRLITNLSWGRPSPHVCQVARRAAASCAAGKINCNSQFLVRSWWGHLYPLSHV